MTEDLKMNTQEIIFISIFINTNKNNRDIKIISYKIVLLLLKQHSKVDYFLR